MRNHHQTGFSLMELIGVMAVLAILSAALAPSVFELINDAYAKQEQENLDSLAADLRRLIETERRIPSSNRANWSGALAAFSDLPASRVLSNERGFQRTLYFDPRFFTTSDSNFNGYTQTGGLSSAPISPRVMLISNLRANAPQPAMNAATFDQIWNQTSGATVVESDDIKITRLNLGDLFHRLTVTNTATAQAGFSIEGGVIQALIAGNGVTDGISTRYLIEGSRVEFYGTPFPSGALNTVVVVNDSVGMRYATDGAAWYWEPL